MADGGCPECGLERSKVVLVEVWGLYDGGLYFQCPACGYAWHRWPEGDRLHAKAAGYVDAAQRAWAANQLTREGQALGLYDPEPLCRLCGGKRVMHYVDRLTGDEGEHACPWCGNG